MKTHHFALCLSACFLLLIASGARGDGARDNVSAVVRRIPPPPAHEISKEDRATLQAGVDALGKEIESLQTELAGKPALLAYLPDVRIFYNAVRYPLTYDETIDLKSGQAALAEGIERAKALRAGKTPWASVSGPRGYVSKIDGSVQPYVLNLPADCEPTAGEQDKREAGKGYRLDVSCHGRDENLTELRFIQQKPSKPTGKLVLNLYGRYCNANKFAGEIDCLEAMSAVERLYPIDKNRVLIIGFSMGGAACWEFSVHYTDRWAAASPGAGFAESERFLDVFQHEKVAPPWYEQTLFHLYDCTDYAANLYNLKLIAYAGELDPQKQASDVMLEAMAKEGLKLQRIIGPGVKHQYEKNAKIELDHRLDDILSKDRNPVPPKIRFTTWTLRYNHMYWVRVTGLEHEWVRARVDAELKPDGIEAKTSNVTRLEFSFPPGHSPFPPGATLTVTIDGTKLQSPPIPAGGAVELAFQNEAGAWKPEARGDDALRKRPGLQGPIDDAFMEPFLIVRPTGKPMNEKCGAWEQAELEHAISQWRSQFRGEAPVKDDRQVTDTDIARCNLVCFGDPSSNQVLAKLADKLPIKWTGQAVELGSRSFPADHHVPVLIYPNPLAPSHYLVVNSGVTYREYDYLNNARQTPKLPDYAVMDVDVARTPRSPAGVVAAGFFDEAWKLQADDGKAAVSKH